MGYVQICDLCGERLIDKPYNEYRVKRRWYSFIERGWEKIEAHDECVKKLLDNKIYIPQQKGERKNENKGIYEE